MSNVMFVPRWLFKRHETEPQQPPSPVPDAAASVVQQAEELARLVSQLQSRHEKNMKELGAS